MTKGKVCLIPFPFDDLSATKVRPVVCLTDPIGSYRHIVIAFITSQVSSDLLETDLVLDIRHADFPATGLRFASVLRLHRIVTVTTSLIQRELGVLSPAIQTEVGNNLRKLFG